MNKLSNMNKMCYLAVQHCYGDNPELALWEQLSIRAHTALCPKCAAEKRKLAMAQELLLLNTMPAAPDLANTIMLAIFELQNAQKAKEETALGAFSLRLWVFAGVFIVLSLTTAFLGGGFSLITTNNGLAFLLPLGITVGGVITVYGALFIYSHLNQLCEKFGLHNHSQA